MMINKITPFCGLKLFVEKKKGIPFLKIGINLPRTYDMRSYTVKEKHIGSAVSEILRYRQKKLI